MPSRLDRLFTLLESGGSSVTRKAAAHQLGEVVRLHPYDLDCLIARLHTYITSKSWETRISAGQAVTAIVRNIDKWDPVPVCKIESQDDDTSVSQQKGHLSIQSFSIKSVLEKGSYLMADSEKQFENDEEDNMDANERAAKQRVLVNQSLGLDVGQAIGLDTEALFSNSDLIDTAPVNQSIPKESVSHIVNIEMATAGLKLSSREINQAKRKQKVLFRQSSKGDPKMREEDLMPCRKKQKLDKEDGHSDDENMLTIAEDSTTKEMESWPLGAFCDQLTLDLFNCCWETRHGAATALRDIIKVQGECAGKCTSHTAQQMKRNNEIWLEDKAVRLVCVLALDRFGDFIADQVVAPVRETCAQALGSVVQLLPEGVVWELLGLVQEMLQWTNWATRHGGLLGLKYILAVRKDLTTQLLVESYSQIYEGLKDEVDDVAAVAAMCLVPVADQLAKCIDQHKMDQLLLTLWDTLLDLDDLTASTNSILALLSKLLSYTHIMASMRDRLHEFVPRLWPFLYHNNISIRCETLKTLVTLSAPSAFAAHSNPDSKTWMEAVLSELLVQMYQRSLLEANAQNLSYVRQIWSNTLTCVSLSSVLVICCPIISSWLCLLMTNPRLALDSNFITIPQHKMSERQRKGPVGTEGALSSTDEQTVHQFYLGGGSANAANDFDLITHTTQAQCCASKLLGELSKYIVQPMPGVTYESDDAPVVCYLRLLLAHVTSRSSSQRIGAAMVIREWASLAPGVNCHPMLKEGLLTALTQTVYYEEIAWSFARVQQEAQDFIVLLKHYKFPIDDTYNASPILTLDQLCQLTSSQTEDMIWVTKSRKKIQELLNDRRKSIQTSVTNISNEQLRLSITVQSLLAGAVIRLNCLPEKLNPVIKPLMDSIKKECNATLQEMAASDLVHLIEHCIKRETSPNGKVLTNLSNFLCIDVDYTPKVSRDDRPPVTAGVWSVTFGEQARLLQRSASISNRGPGRPKTVDAELELTPAELQTRRVNSIQRLGCVTALKNISSHFGANLLTQLPPLESLVLATHLQTIKDFSCEYNTPDAGQKVINWLYLLEVIIPSLENTVLQTLLDRVTNISQWVCHPYSAVRHLCARVLSTLALAKSVPVMIHVILELLPQLKSSPNLSAKEGVIEVVHLCIEKLGLKIVPYIVLFILPLLGCMSDRNESIRLVATQCFANLVRLYPLGEDCPLPEACPQQMKDEVQKQKMFLEYLSNPSKIENYTIPVPINVELRSYQQLGVNWLSFLNRYGLHGILCDDMGLGKTLQSICILAGDHFYKEKCLDNSKDQCVTGVQSLVVCPSTLTSHWFYEIGKFVAKEHLNPLNYNGPPLERKRLRDAFYRHNVIIASYKIIRNEINFFSRKKWNYIILDEGHVIKNVKTKSSQAIKELVGGHRLILSGTPIQNNVIELWSLFDFLMPGYLGTERNFHSYYAKPIIQSRDAKSSPKDQEVGVFAMDMLHRQTLPFLLRRLKEEVLKDLPPKITQDYYCELSPLQEKLYEDFAKSQNCNALELGSDQPMDADSSPTHVFQALQYLRRLCNHPRLVLKQSHPKYQEIIDNLKQTNSSLTDIAQSAKLPALRQLLLDCGIGSCEEAAGSEVSCSVVSPHRALVFCQYKSMLDIIEKDLLKGHMKSVTYLRLDGSVPAGSRHALVQRFNSDPSIDLLLLTTHVGGLGLNLTGADTVIFVEHDWNPMRDLQAMDRAHRIGQKKVVNVYRLITKGTIEEKIMNLQKFKIDTANSVISKENANLLNMGTDQLLDLFSLDSKPNEHSGARSGGSRHVGLHTGTIKEALAIVPELWSDSQYDDEYNLDSFLNSMKK